LSPSCRAIGKKNVSNAGNQFSSSQHIGKEMRLSKVEYAPSAESGPIFNFYMGKNPPERKDSIMERLGVPVEE
jgi:hypothetical protein